MGRSLGRQLVTTADARLVGVTDVSPEARARATEELKAPGFTDAETLLAEPGVDAVLVATPNFLHREYVELAASLGKHVFVEKPLATNLPDCDAMIQAVERAGVQMMVGQVLRYYPNWWQILEMINRGDIGRPVGIQLTRISGGWNGWPLPWRNSLALSGGLLMEVNAHEIDFMCQVCGDVERVYAEADQFVKDGTDYPNLYFVSLRFKNGAIGLLHSSTISAVQDLTGKIQGTEGSIAYVDGFGPGAVIRSARREGEVETLRVAEIQVEQPVRKELRLFVEALLAGLPVPITTAEGRRNVAIALAAYESARTGQPVVPG
jgi:predicted dehydrogenase